MRVFSIETKDKTDWIAADTNIEALKFYCSGAGKSLVNYGDDVLISEIPEQLWDILTGDYDMSENRVGSNQMKTFRQLLDGARTCPFRISTSFPKME